MKRKHFRDFLIAGLMLLIITDANAQRDSYITVQGHQFILDNKPVYFIGTNYWYGGFLGLQTDKQKGIERLRKELDFLKGKGITNLRILAGPEGEGSILAIQRVGPPLQKDKNIFDKDFLTGLDILLSEMGKRSMKAVIFLSNNWEWSGGFLQYLRWNNEIHDSVFHRQLSWDETRDYTSKFYSCEACKTDYLKQATYILNRINTITNKKYTDDPAIMSWEIANEPRPMRPAAINNYKKWIADIAGFIKSQDQNHLVTIGTEGYIGTENLDIYEAIHADKNVDYLTIHIWPKNWEWFKGNEIAAGMDSVLTKTMDYISIHLNVAKRLDKPLVIEEFGLPRDGHSFELTSSTFCRDKYFQSIFSELQKSKSSRNALGGADFWSYGGIITPAHVRWREGDDYIGDPPMEEQGLNAVFNSDKTTWNVIGSFCKKLNQVD